MWVFALFIFGVLLFYSFRFLPFSSSLIFILASLFLVYRKKALLILVLTAGIVYAFARFTEPQETHYTADILEISGRCVSSPLKTESGLKQSFRINKAGYGLSDREIILLSDKGLESGQEHTLEVKLLKSIKRFNPGDSSPDDIYGKIARVTGSRETEESVSKWIEGYRCSINQYIGGHFSGDSAAFLASVTTGQRTSMSDAMRDAFNRSGLAHMLSISGTHFSLLSVMLFGIFRLIIHMLPYRGLHKITVYLTPSQASAILCLPFMAMYLGLSGASIPAVRSFIMTGLFLAGLLMGRKGFWLNSILFAAFIIVIADPDALFSLSFQLSFIAVLSIGLALDTDSKENNNSSKFLLYLKKALLISIAASAATAPLTAYYFHYFSLISPFSNLIAAPAIGFTVIPLSVVSAFIYIFTGYYPFTYILSLLTETGLSLTRFFSEIPFAGITVPDFPPALILLFYTGFAPYFIYGRKKYLLLAPFLPLTVFILISSTGRQDLSVTFLDAGQGDSAVIELPDGKVMLTDTGKTGREAVSFLKYRGKKKVDILAISHAHPDHTGGLEYVAEKFPVGEIWDNGKIILPDRLKYLTQSHLQRGDLIEGQGYRISVLHPYPEFYTSSGREYDSANNDSLVFRIDSPKISFLFTGDIEKEAEEDIRHLGKWLESDVVKIPHHGAKTSADEFFFKLVSPGVAVISAGRDNSFGHPHQEMLEALNSARAYRTDTAGAVKISANGSGLTIKTWKDFQFNKADTYSQEIKNIKRLFMTW